MQIQLMDKKVSLAPVCFASRRTCKIFSRTVKSRRRFKIREITIDTVFENDPKKVS